MEHPSAANLYTTRKHPAHSVTLPDTRSIRVVHLQPAPSLDDPIDCRLTTTSLDTPVPYEAMSYTWGPPLTDTVLGDQAVTLEGAVYSVTGNLFDALRRFRRPDSVRIMWIDALCIDQESTAEKSIQVMLMASIYATAQHVLIWLGEDCPARDGELILRFYAFISERSIWGGGDRPLEERLGAHDFQAELAIEADEFLMRRVAITPAARWVCEAEECMWARRRYFTRRWIIQEVLNAREASVHCGAVGTSWHPFERGMRKLQNLDLRKDAYPELRDFTRHPLACDLRTSVARDIHSHLVDLCTIDTSLGGRFTSDDDVPGPRFSLGNEKEIVGERRLLQLLAGASNAECQVELDRIYALLGFPGLRLRSSMLPQYDITISECFDGLANRCIAAGIAMELIYQAAEQSHRGRSASLPSWIPDWRLTVVSLHAVNDEGGGSSPFKRAVRMGSQLFLHSARLVMSCDGCARRSAGQGGNATCTGGRDTWILLPSNGPWRSGYSTWLNPGTEESSFTIQKQMYWHPKEPTCSVFETRDIRLV